MCGLTRKQHLTVFWDGDARTFYQQLSSADCGTYKQLCKHLYDHYEVGLALFLKYQKEWQTKWCQGGEPRIVIFVYCRLFDRAFHIPIWLGDGMREAEAAEPNQKLAMQR